MLLVLRLESVGADIVADPIEDFHWFTIWIEEIAKATLESVAYQTRDLLDAMQADWTDGEAQALRVDGGMSASDWAMQFLSDIIGAPVDRPEVLETTALGAAWLAGRRRRSGRASSR